MYRNENNDRHIWKIWKAGQSDPRYRAMLMEIRILEKKYDAVLRALPEKQQDIICDYVSLCEEMNWRMLEIACEMNKTPGA